MCIRDRLNREQDTYQPATSMETPKTIIQRIRRYIKNGETGRATTALLTTPTFETDITALPQ
eukprot:6835000-Prorocentrum_lima.AAC.1